MLVSILSVADNRCDEPTCGGGPCKVPTSPMNGYDPQKTYQGQKRVLELWVWSAMEHHGKRWYVVLLFSGGHKVLEGANRGPSGEFAYLKGRVPMLPT
jgi:hypothetical protein